MTRVRKCTQRRRIVSARWGVVEAIEVQRVWKDCPQGPVLRSGSLSALAGAGKRYAYDTIALVGWLYFREELNVAQVRERFHAASGIWIPPRSIVQMIHEFVEFHACVQEAAGDRIREEIQRHGGYVLHVDSTYEPGSEVLVVCLGRVGAWAWVLGSLKSATESQEAVTTVLKDVRDTYGLWRGAVRDLSGTIHKALERTAPGVAQFACHWHFLCDLGKKLLQPARQLLAQALDKYKLSSQLKEAKKDARQALKKQAPESQARSLAAVLECPESDRLLEPLALSRGLECVWSQWLRAYRRDGKGASFPFSHPEVDYVRRCQKAYPVLRSWAQASSPDAAVRRTVERVFAIVRPVCEQEMFGEGILRYQQARKEFDEIRDVLRIAHRRGRVDAQIQSAQARACQAEQIEQSLADYQNRLKQRLADCPEGETLRCLTIITGQLEKHGSTLTGHVLATPQGVGSGRIVADRTNNVLETLFGRDKQGHRRRNGHKNVGREIRGLPPDAPKVLNLSDERYMNLVYGGQDWLAMARLFPTVTNRVAGRRAQERQVPLYDFRLRPRQQADGEIPEQISKVYSQFLGKTGT
jgi:hypothetical protein